MNNPNVYGGNEPATAWYTAFKPISTIYGPVALPPVDPKYKDGFGPGRIPNVIGLNQAAAKARVEAAGFKTTVSWVNNSAANGTVVSTSPTTNHCS